MYGWLRDNGLPEGGQILVLSCNESKGMGERCTLAHIDSKKCRYACNEIKLPAMEFDTDRLPVTGTLALHDVRCRSQSNEENRNMPKSDMIGTEGEITAVHRGGVRHAEV